MWDSTWKRSVPPAVASGSMISVRYYCRFRSPRLTHPLPQVVLTSSNKALDFAERVGAGSLPVTNHGHRSHLKTKHFTPDSLRRLLISVCTLDFFLECGTPLGRGQYHLR